jgi:hypothetical protein
MELAELITSRVAGLTGEVELLRKQLADAEHELERLVIAGQVITQLTAEDAAAAGEPGAAGPAQRGFGLLVPPRSQASGPGDLPGDYRSLPAGCAAARPGSSPSRPDLSLIAAAACRDAPGGPIGACESNHRARRGHPACLPVRAAAVAPDPHLRRRPAAPA